MNRFPIPFVALILCVGGRAQEKTVHDVDSIYGRSAPSDESRADHGTIRGMTISCQTWGWEWGTDGFALELERLGELGANWIAIHPYASVGANGSVSHRRDALDPNEPPPWLSLPGAASRERDFAFFVKPHLAYWGSPFTWRGEIDFSDEDHRARFWREYGDWIVALATVTRDADAFCVGTELGCLIADESEWRALIARVRDVTDAPLTYAANWDEFEQVPFWDALDAIGVQAYFPLSDRRDPTDEDVRAGWEPVIARLRKLHERTGKPVVFTELGYSASELAASRPWEDPRRGAPLVPGLQRRCLAISLDILDREREWLRGVFLWKWFVGASHHRAGSFLLDVPELRETIRRAWR